MSIFTKVGQWISKVWKSLKDNTDTVAIAITEEVQAGLKSGTLTSLAQIVEDVLPTSGKLPEQVVADLQVAVPKILAFELAVQGLPDNPTAADIQAFETNILTAFGLSNDHSKLWTTLAAQVYGIIKADVDSGVKYTFAQCVIDVESAYNAYVQDLQNQQSGS